MKDRSDSSSSKERHRISRLKNKEYWKNNSPFSEESIKLFGEKKRCYKRFCYKEYPRTQEHWVTSPSRRDGLDPHCRHCYPDKALWSRYGIRQTDKNKIHSFQKSKCGVCGKKISRNGDAFVDHNHSIGMGDDGRVSGLTTEQKRNSINGLVCSTCNRLMGMLNKLDINPLLAAERVEHFLRVKPAQAYFNTF